MQPLSGTGLRAVGHRFPWVRLPLAVTTSSCVPRLDVLNEFSPVHESGVLPLTPPVIDTDVSACLFCMSGDPRVFDFHEGVCNKFHVPAVK